MSGGLPALGFTEQGDFLILGFFYYETRGESGKITVSVHASSTKKE